MSDTSGGSLSEFFLSITDPRLDREKRHSLHDVLIISVCAMLCGVEMEELGDAKEEWFKTFLELPNGIPSHDTFNRVFGLLEPKEFQSAFTRWTAGLRRALSEKALAIDRNALSGSATENRLVVDVPRLHTDRRWATVIAILGGTSRPQRVCEPVNLQTCVEQSILSWRENKERKEH